MKYHFSEKFNMSDSDTDENAEHVKNGNYKSPSKKKRQKVKEKSPPKTYLFEINLSDHNGQDYTEVSYLDLVSKEEQRLRKLAAAQKQMPPGMDPLGGDEDAELMAEAARFEAKYGNYLAPKKKGKKRKLAIGDIGDGYDESDPFIDNSECFEDSRRKGCIVFT